jgi:hypothetical protein
MPRTIGARTLQEMRRVTKPDGTIITVDYDLPENAMGRFLLYHCVHLFEREHYAAFMRSDLHALLAAAGIGVRSTRRALWGAARIVTRFRRETVQVGSRRRLLTRCSGCPVRPLLLLDEGRGHRVGLRKRLAGRVFGMDLAVEKIVSERHPPQRKVWEMIGAPKLVVIGHYRMGFEIVPKGYGSQLRVFID